MPVKNKLYFAYGSNMNQARLEQRVGPVVKVGSHILPRWKLAFNCGYLEHRFANIIMTGHNEGEWVQGVLYEMSPKQMRILDRYEGYPLYYQKVEFPLNELSRQVFYAYVCFNPYYQPHPSTKPTAEYIDHIMKGIAQNGLRNALSHVIKLKNKGEIELAQFL